MLNLRFIQENPELVVEKLKKKNFDASAIVEQISDLYKAKNEIQVKADQFKAEMNQLSREIGQLFRDGKQTEANQAKERTSELKENIKQLDDDFAKIDEQVYELQVQLPNLPADLVSAGKTPQDNEVVKTGGEQPALGADKLP
nr:serine--tRNA ligase [Sunxiuqinia sp.]